MSDGTPGRQQQWLSLSDVAAAGGVSVEVVRAWCIRWREGKPGGLPYAHGGAKPEAEAARVNYRVHVDDWRQFDADRRRIERAEDRRVTKLVAAPLDYGGRRGEAAAVRGR